MLKSLLPTGRGSHARRAHSFIRTHYEQLANTIRAEWFHGKVWVNTETHMYHKEGSRFYGTTKKGKYMTEAEAIKEGNKAAQH